MPSSWRVLLKRIPSQQDQTVGEFAMRLALDVAFGRPHDFQMDVDALEDHILDTFVDMVPDSTLCDLFGWTDDGERNPRGVAPNFNSPTWNVFRDHVRGLAVFAVSHVQDELALKTERSWAFDRGNHAAAYKDPSDTATVPKGYATHQREGYLMGFYSSRELDEIPNEHRLLIRRLRAQEDEPKRKRKGCTYREDGCKHTPTEDR